MNYELIRSFLRCCGHVPRRSGEMSHGTQGFLAGFARIYSSVVMSGGAGLRPALSVAEHIYVPLRICFVWVGCC